MTPVQIPAATQVPITHMNYRNEEVCVLILAPVIQTSSSAAPLIDRER